MTDADKPTLAELRTEWLPLTAEYPCGLDRHAPGARPTDCIRCALRVALDHADALTLEAEGERYIAGTLRADLEAVQRDNVLLYHENAALRAERDSEHYSRLRTKMARSPLD